MSFPPPLQRKSQISTGFPYGPSVFFKKNEGGGKDMILLFKRFDHSKKMNFNFPPKYSIFQKITQISQKINFKFLKKMNFYFLKKYEMNFNFPQK